MARPVRFGCCGARSQLSFYHIITFKLVRSGEIEPPDGLCAISGSAPSRRGAFWWNFRLILGASKSTSGAPLALLESKNMRFQKA